MVKKVFPEICALCRERGIAFTDVDLRWELTEEKATLGHIVRTCLEEVDKCRPDCNRRKNRFKRSENVPSKSVADNVREESFR
ncbi:MAG: hypothetical protein AB7H80_13355 [Candidatus Kapaibacterium sp.]